MPRATNTEPAFGFKISWNPIYIAHHISHVHVNIEFFEIQGENNQCFPRMSCGQAYRKKRTYIKYKYKITLSQPSRAAAADNTGQPGFIKNFKSQFRSNILKYILYTLKYIKSVFNSQQSLNLNWLNSNSSIITMQIPQKL